MPNETLTGIANKAAGVGIAQREYEFAGMKVVLRVLKVSEELQVRRELTAAATESPMAMDYLYKLEALGRAVHSVDGVDILAETHRLSDKVGQPEPEKVAFVKNLLLSMGVDSVELLYKCYRALCDQVKLKLLKPFSLADLLTTEEQQDLAKLEMLQAIEARKVQALVGQPKS